MFTFILSFIVSLYASARTVERIDIDLADGSKHSAVLSLPKRSQGSLPVVIVLGGFKTGEKSVGLLKEDLDVIYATTDYPYKKPGERNFVADLKEVPAIKKAVGRTDLAADALIKRLASDKRVNREKITMVGASFGAPFAITAAARNSDVDAVVLIHGFGRPDLAITQQLVNVWGKWSYPFAWLLGQVAWSYLSYPNPENEVLKLHREQKVFYIYSDADEQLPAESIVTLQSALSKSPAKISTIKSSGGHLGPGRKEILNELIDISLKWMKDEQLL